jgi:hypothetical protein
VVVTEPVLNQGRWWYQQPDGTWLLWNQDSSRWEVPEPPQGVVQRVPHLSYRDLSTRSAWLVGLLILGIAVDVVAFVSDLAEYGLISRIIRGLPVTEAQALANDSRQGMIGLAQLITYAATAAAFVVWFWAAYANLPALGTTNLRFGTGWAIGGWFVPILSLWRPKQLANDIWRASDPELPPGEADRWKGRDVAPLLHWWWGAFLVGGWLGIAALRQSYRAETVEQIRTVSAVQAWSDASWVVAGILAVLVVSAATRRQQARRTLIVSQGARPS